MLHLRAGWQTQTKLKTSWYEILQNRDSQIETSSCVCARRGCPAADICSPVASCQLWFLSHSSQIWETPTARLQVWTLSANHARLTALLNFFRGKRDSSPMCVKLGDFYISVNVKVGSCSSATPLGPAGMAWPTWHVLVHLLLIRSWI